MNLRAIVVLLALGMSAVAARGGPPPAVGDADMQRFVSLVKLQLPGLKDEAAREDFLRSALQTVNKWQLGRKIADFDGPLIDQLGAPDVDARDNLVAQMLVQNAAEEAGKVAAAQAQGRISEHTAKLVLARLQVVIDARQATQHALQAIARREALRSLVEARVDTRDDLLQAMHDASPLVRAYGVALAKAWDTDSTVRTRLRELVKDANPAVSDAAAEASSSPMQQQPKELYWNMSMGRLDAPMVDELLAGVASDDAALRKLAVLGLHEGCIVSVDKVVPALATVIASDPSDEVRMVATESLHGLGSVLPANATPAQRKAYADQYIRLLEDTTLEGTVLHAVVQHAPQDPSVNKAMLPVVTRLYASKNDAAALRVASDALVHVVYHEGDDPATWKAIDALDGPMRERALQAIKGRVEDFFWIYALWHGPSADRQVALDPDYFPRPNVDTYAGALGISMTDADAAVRKQALAQADDMIRTKAPAMEKATRQTYMRVVIAGLKESDRDNRRQAFQTAQRPECLVDADVLKAVADIAQKDGDELRADAWGALADLPETEATGDDVTKDRDKAKARLDGVGITAELPKVIEDRDPAVRAAAMKLWPTLRRGEPAVGEKEMALLAMAEKVAGVLACVLFILSLPGFTRGLRRHAVALEKASRRRAIIVGVFTGAFLAGASLSVVSVVAAGHGLPTNNVDEAGFVVLLAQGAAGIFLAAWAFANRRAGLLDMGMLILSAGGLLVYCGYGLLIQVLGLVMYQVPTTVAIGVTMVQNVLVVVGCASTLVHLLKSGLPPRMPLKKDEEMGEEEDWNPQLA